MTEQKKKIVSEIASEDFDIDEFNGNEDDFEDWLLDDDYDRRKKERNS